MTTLEDVTRAAQARILAAADLRPGDVYADADGNPVADSLASHGGLPVGAIPRPWAGFVPLTVARVVPSDHPAWPAPHWVYVEASNGHGCTVRASMRVHVMPRGWGRYAITEEAHGWRWTYTDITREEADHIASTLNRPGETWTVSEIGWQS